MYSCGPLAILTPVIQIALRKIVVFEINLLTNELGTMWHTISYCSVVGLFDS